jgi:hypothetical protein
VKVRISTRALVNRAHAAQTAFVEAVLDPCDYRRYEKERNAVHDAIKAIGRRPGHYKKEIEEVLCPKECCRQGCLCDELRRIIAGWK